MTTTKTHIQATTTRPLQECPEAAATARSLAVRTGRHRRPPPKPRWWLHGSRANGTHRDDSDTDIVLLPVDVTGDPWAELSRTLKRFPKGSTRPVWIDNSGTDIVVAESWKTLNYNLVRLDTAPVQCWSTCQQPVREHCDDSEKQARPGHGATGLLRLPSRRLHEQNAVIYADSNEILDAA